ncbi:hypothetical protein GPALN_001968 [Globodera pallida]|nr:hypothetical protein GPALN_001968 [Globodera pallida]
MNASETTNCGTEMTGVAYVMIDADRISSRIFPAVRMFCIQDEIDVGITRRIIGYCVPLQSYETEFEAAPEPTRLIIPNKAVDNQFVDTFKNYYKFKIRPIFVVPSDANAFQQMSRSAPPQLRDHRILKASAICIRTDMEPILMRRARLSQVSKSLQIKFRLGRNPHLVPLRLPSGAECYLLLDLAEHCRDIYNASKEPEFAHYHFRELQIEDAKTLAAEAAAVAEVSNTNAEVRSSPNSVAECSTTEQRPGTTVAECSTTEQRPGTTVAECSTTEQRPGTSKGTNNDDNMTSPPIKPLTYAQATANGPRRNAASTSDTKSFQKLSEVAGGPELNDGLSSRTPEQQRQQSAEENISPTVSSESSAKALEVSLSPVPTPPPALLPFSFGKIIPTLNMEEKEAAKKKLMKRKFPLQPPLIARKTLNPQAYEANAVKQMQSYKQSKSMELFKERSMKFTCVDSSRQQRQETGSGGSGREGTSGSAEQLSGTLSSIATSVSVSACPVDMMDPSDREAIQFYEGERDGGRRTNGVRTKVAEAGGVFGNTSLDRAKRLEFFPRFNPRILPPQLPPQIVQQQKVNEQPQKHRQMKQEIDVEEVFISDEIPSFQVANVLTVAPEVTTLEVTAPEVTICQPSKAVVQYAEIEDKKKKLQLLWSICQEELTVDAELEKTGEELVELRKNLDALAKALKAKEEAEGSQKLRKKRIDERKKLLLTGVCEEGEPKKVKREETEPAEG